MVIISEDKTNWPERRLFTEIDEKLAFKLRRIAIFSIIVSTLCTVCAVLVVPLLFSYVQYIQSKLQVKIKIILFF